MREREKNSFFKSALFSTLQRRGTLEDAIYILERRSNARNERKRERMEGSSREGREEEVINRTKDGRGHVLVGHLNGLPIVSVRMNVGERERIYACASLEGCELESE